MLIGEGKWQVSWDLWPWKTYPNYLFGPAVLIPGGEGVGRLLTAAKTTPYYRIDDVYLNGLLPEKAKINITSIERFQYFIFHQKESTNNEILLKKK